MRLSFVAVAAAGFLLLVVNGLIVFGAVSGALAILVAALLALFVSLTIIFGLGILGSLEHGDGFAVDTTGAGSAAALAAGKSPAPSCS